VFDALGTRRLLGSLATALESRRDAEDDVALQAAFTLVSPVHDHAQRQGLMLAHGQLLRSPWGAQW
jgi:hypothetical protein